LSALLVTIYIGICTITGNLQDRYIQNGHDTRDGEHITGYRSRTSDKQIWNDARGQDRQMKKRVYPYDGEKMGMYRMVSVSRELNAKKEEALATCI